MVSPPPLPPPPLPPSSHRQIAAAFVLKPRICFSLPGVFFLRGFLFGFFVWGGGGVVGGGKGGGRVLGSQTIQAATMAHQGLGRVSLQQQFTEGNYLQSFCLRRVIGKFQ